MFRLRRFRLFLLVTVLIVFSVYELYHINNWDAPDFERFAHIPGTKTTPEAPVPPARGDDQPAFVPPPAPPAASPVEEKPAPARPEEAAATTSGSAPPDKQKDVGSPAEADESPLSDTEAGDKSTYITGEELLEKPPKDYFGEHGQARLDVKPHPADKPRAQWRQQAEHFPVQKVISLPSGPAQSLPHIQHKFAAESASKKKDRQMKQKAVREAFKHAWTGYKQYALPHDELKPLSNTSADPFNGWGATLVDSLDTMWLMGLTDEFEAAMTYVAEINFKSSPRKDIPLFETTIRYLGGLLGAYDVSNAKYPILLEKAVELADVIMGAFDTPNRMPIPFYQWAPSYASQPHRSSSHIVMAEIGSLAVEFARLSQITKEEKYYDAIARVTDALEEWQMDTSFPGVWPVRLDSSGCKKPNFDSVHSALRETAGGGALDKRQLDDAPERTSSNEEKASVGSDTGSEIGEEPAKLGSDNEAEEDQDSDDIFVVDCESQGLAHEPNAKVHTYSIAAMADSTYEYFPKMHALLGGRNSQYRNMYIQSMRTIRKDFLFRPMIKDSKRDLRFLAKHEIRTNPKGSQKNKETIYEATHLGCFAGGMFALGAKVFDIPSDMELAAKLTDGCVWAYESTPLGVMAEEFTLTPCEDDKDCPWDESRWHDHLDPHMKERFEAVDLYNQQQKALAAGESPQTSDTDRLDAAARRTKRQEADHDPQDAAPSPSRTLAVEAEHHDDTYTAPDTSNPATTIFQPKVALSHAKYVSARILEERLPPSYTRIHSRAYKLRPEAIESVFIMYRLTGDDSWREKGWKMFQAVERAARTPAGHATVKDVTSQLGDMEDTMESFWLAETLKYFWLLFEEESVLDLGRWVLNTEAHGFKLGKEAALG
jgi:mannosyl-oligosaccharide alpha-1,2-mannosidase